MPPLLSPHSKDEFNKTYFPNPDFSVDAASGPFYTGVVTPALHYCMGGVEIDDDARVLKQHGQGQAGKAIVGLFAAGEVVGGIHGNNRLAGNALTECVVFGRIAAASIQSFLRTAGQGVTVATPAPVGRPVPTPVPSPTRPGPVVVTKAQLAAHNGEGGNALWVALYGKVYDLTAFAADHPGGEESITRVAGVDGTKAFATVHTPGMLDDFTPIGTLKV